MINEYRGSNNSNTKSQPKNIKEICIAENIDTIQERLEKKMDERAKLITYKIQFG